MQSKELDRSPLDQHLIFNTTSHFETLLKQLKVITVSDIVNGTAEKSLNSCIEYIQSAFPNTRCELYRKTAYHLFNKMFIPPMFRQYNDSLTLLRYLIFIGNINENQVLSAVLMHAFQDLKLELLQMTKTKTDQQNKEIALKPYVNPDNRTKVKVSIGTGYDFFSQVLTGELNGYNLEQSGMYGLFLSPHDSNASKVLSRTICYATTTPFVYFDLPVAIEFEVDIQYLFHKNHNRNEVIIKGDDFHMLAEKKLLQEIKYQRFEGQTFEKSMPASLTGDRFKKDVVQNYPSDIADLIINELPPDFSAGFKF